MRAALQSVGIVASVVVAIGVMASCSSPARAVAPNTPTFAEATQRESCKVVHGRNEPFIVDWPADRRADLEALSKERIPVVAYSCDSLELLPDCQVEGHYKFVGVTEKEESLKLEDTDEVKANLPFSGLALAGKLGGELSRGSSVDIGFAIIGKQISTRRDLLRTSLEGTCAGATHFVGATTVGAFSMSVGAKATTHAAADLFAAGAGSTSASSRSAHSQDGDLAACRKADSDATAAAPGCASPIRLELKPIEEVAAKNGVSTLDEIPPVCPAGLVPTDDGKCTHASDKAHLCNPTDPADCELQCTRGSATSCALYARRLQLGNGVPRDLDRAVRLYDKACKDGALPACGRLGEHLLTQQKPDEGLPLVKKACAGGWFTACEIWGTYETKAGGAAKQDVFAMFERACDGGDAEGCWSLGVLFSQGIGVHQNDGEALRYFAESCDAGAKLGCVSYAKAIDEGKGTPSDPPRAAKLLGASCDRGYSDACSALAMMSFMGRGVAKDTTRGVELLQRACDGTDATACFVLGMRYRNGVGVPRDESRAGALFEKACATGFELACAARSR